MKRITALALIICIALLAGCASAPKSADLNAVKESVVSRYDAEEFISLSADDLLDMYGIKAEDAKQFAAIIARNSTSADEILLFEAVDAAAADRIRQKLDNRYQAKLNENRDYLPDEYEKVSACKVEKSGNYLSMIVSADAQELTKLYQDAFK